MSRPIVAITIDTEEDNWGHYGWEGATTKNILELSRVQEVFEKWGARPTYLTNYAPVNNVASVAAMGELAALESVEIGAHCHPWNTPPRTAVGERHSMMSEDDRETNRAKISSVLDRITSELGVRPRVFRAGRWALSSSVAQALEDLGVSVDCSVSPGIDWTGSGGPDFSEARFGPYRFDPVEPLVPKPGGSLVELPTTVGFLRGDRVAQGRRRSMLERSYLAKLRVVGVLDRLGLLARRWLSPETSNGGTMISLSDEVLEHGATFLQMTFHSSVLLPGGTPFVANEGERESFLRSVDITLGHLCDRGARFCTMSEASASLFSQASHVTLQSACSSKALHPSRS